MGDKQTVMDEKVIGRFRKVFYGSAGLSAFIVLHLVALGFFGSLSLLVSVLLVPMLLWSIVVTVYAFRAVMDLAQEQAQTIKDMTDRDSLTGVFTSEYMRERLKKAREHAFEVGKAAAFSYLRIIGLERINSEFGHAVGDIVLCGMAEEIEDVAGEDGVVARLGGQEFSMLLPETSLGDAKEKMQTLRQNIKEFELELGERGHITGMDVRIGIAGYPCDAETPAGITQTVSIAADGRELEAGVRIIGQENVVGTE